MCARVTVMCMHARTCRRASRARTHGQTQDGQTHSATHMRAPTPQVQTCVSVANKALTDRHWGALEVMTGAWGVWQLATATRPGAVEPLSLPLLVRVKASQHLDPIAQVHGAKP